LSSFAFFEVVVSSVFVFGSNVLSTMRVVRFDAEDLVDVEPEARPEGRAVLQHGVALPEPRPAG
jgi:hypothetical protein